VQREVVAAVAVERAREAVRPLPLTQGPGNLFTRNPGLAGRQATVAMTRTWVQVTISHLISTMVSRLVYFVNQFFDFRVAVEEAL
jgi:hypothetical protein